MKLIKKGVLIIICCCTLTACQQAKEQQLWEETMRSLETGKQELNQSNQLSQQLVSLIHKNENDPRRTTYLTLLRDLKQYENDLIEWEASIPPLDSARAYLQHDSLVSFLEKEKLVVDSLKENLSATIHRCQAILAESVKQ